MGDLLGSWRLAEEPFHQPVADEVPLFEAGIVAHESGRDLARCAPLVA
ncbi:hypothetical protein AACH10_12455 [Ideonella sp. DXS22W]|uniref:Uncharacterized protein n=1 Tax=Pseudaquabacterium inlustre TaxID=2984192 RepID=A0ABU9CGS0_9BURK